MLRARSVICVSDRSTPSRVCRTRIPAETSRSSWRNVITLRVYAGSFGFDERTVIGMVATLIREVKKLDRSPDSASVVAPAGSRCQATEVTHLAVTTGHIGGPSTGKIPGKKRRKAKRNTVNIDSE